MLTIRKKRPEAEATVADATEADATVAAATEADVAVAAATTDAPPAPMEASPGLEPDGMATSGGVSAKSYTVFAILGIVAAVCVIALLALQFTEFSFYKADPSVWPVK